MLRLDPGEGRIRTARYFRVWEGGGEYNVCRALRKCYGMRTSVVSALVDNEVGHLIEDLIMQGGVDTSHILWRAHDGIGEFSRNGLNFTERGFGLRRAIGCSDRANSAASQLKPGEVDWSTVFIKEKTRWCHTGGIFAALSDSSRELALEAIHKAHENRTITSFDINYRASLWEARSGSASAVQSNRQFASMVDVLVGNEEDFVAAMGLDGKVPDRDFSTIDVERYRSIIGELGDIFPNLRTIAITLRTVKTAGKNDWAAVLWHDGKLYESRVWRDIDVLDRVGGGDGFAAGLFYGLMEFNDARLAVEYGAAHGVLTVTTPGDTSMASLKEIADLVNGGPARIVR
jgi:2-dehydro-3-deoxygluconokinase